MALRSRRPSGTFARRRARPTDDDDPDRTGTYSVGSATSDGQRFRIVRPHARGGLGAVFVALDSELDREVALKQLLDDRADDPTSRFRFLIEAQITGGLEHPGIVPVYGLALTAMADRPEDRFASSRLLADDLDRWMADEPVTAWREPFSRRARRWVRHYRTAVTAAAASVLVALVGTGAVLGVQTQANGRLQQANSELAIANGREKQRFNLAMDAIKVFHGEVSEDLLMKEKQFEGLRTKLLKGAADFYGRLEDLLKGQTDRESRAALGKAYDELGSLTEEIGDQTRALAVQRKALAVRRALQSEPGADAGSKLDLARSLNAVGWLQRSTGDTTGAQASFEEARSLAEEAQTEGARPNRLSVYWEQPTIGSPTCCPRWVTNPEPWRPTARRGRSLRRWPTPIPTSLSSSSPWR